MKKNIRKLLVLATCALALVAISVGATLAYLTDSEAVTNVFTVGKVYISLDESDTDDSTPDAERDTKNTYHLLPGQWYAKDPIVHVEADSEDCYIFVKVENGLDGIEADTEMTPAIEKQLTEWFGWAELEGVENVWYKKHTKADETTDYVVFKSFEIAGTTTNTEIAEYADENITVTAYAIQAAGFDTATEAWAAGNSQNWNN